MKEEQYSTSESRLTKPIQQMESLFITASLSPSQAREREQTTTVISGLICSGPYMRSGPIGSLVRTLLASSLWSSPVRRLKWEVNPLYSERITLFLKDGSNMSLKPFAVILNEKDIPSNRYLYRLVPSVHLTDGTGFGLLPTVTAQDYKRRGPGSSQQGLPDIIHKMLLPTPVATEIHHAERVRKWKSESLPSPHVQIAGEKNPNGLTDFLDFYGILPESLPNDPEEEDMNENNLEKIILHWLTEGQIMPTPTARDWKGAPTLENLKKRGKDTTEEQPSRFLRPDWKEFPTESPICSRDDGFSCQLDCITFSQ